MMELSEVEVNEARWKSRFEWIHPMDVDLSREEIEWTTGRISREEGFRGGQAVQKFAQFVNLEELTGALEKEFGFNKERRRLEELRDHSGELLFDESEMHWFDTFFGSERIKLDETPHGLDAVNGRHRIAIAQECGITALPALVSRKEKSEASFPTMAPNEGETHNMELREIEESAERQSERADELQQEIANHTERVRKLESAVSALEAADKQVHSEMAMQSVQKLREAKEDIAHSLEQKKQEQQQLLEQNAQMTQSNAESHDKSVHALEQIQGVADTLKDAGGQDGSFAQSVSEAMQQAEADVRNRSAADIALKSARQRLEQIFGS